MEVWNSLPDNLASPSRPVSWTIPLNAENASVLTESVARDLYFSALTKFTYLLTYFTKEATQYIISCKTVADTLKITVLNTKTSSAAGGFAP